MNTTTVIRRTPIRSITSEEDEQLRAAARKFAPEYLGFELPPRKKLHRMHHTEHDYLMMLLRGPNDGHGWTSQRVRHRNRWIRHVKAITGEPLGEFVWEGQLCYLRYIEKELSVKGATK
jgi:hypothetical protein